MLILPSVYRECHVCSPTQGVLTAWLMGRGSAIEKKNLLHIDVRAHRHTQGLRYKIQSLFCRGPTPRGLSLSSGFGGSWVRREYRPGSIASPNLGAAAAGKLSWKVSRPAKTHLLWMAKLHRLAKVSLKLHLRKMKIKKSSYSLPLTVTSKTTWQTREMLLNALLESALLLYQHYLLSSVTCTEGKVIRKLNSKRDTAHLKTSSLRRTELSCLFRRKHVWLTLSLHLIGTNEQ